MNTRVIKTTIYLEDDWFNTLSIPYKYLFIYLFTNSHIGLSGIYQLSDRVICLETGLTQEELNNAKPLFEKANKAFFKDGWIYITNAAKHNRFTSEVKKKGQFAPNVVALNKELLLIPGSIYEYFNSCHGIPYRYPIDSTNKHNTLNIKHKSLNIKKNEDVKEKETSLALEAREVLNTPEDKKAEQQERELQTNGKQYGNPDINFLVDYFKQKLNLPLLDESEKTNRHYCHLLIQKYKGRDAVQLLIDTLATHSFWSTKITSFKALFYKAVNIISSNREQRFAVTKV